VPFDEAHFRIIGEEVQRHLEDTEASKLGHWHAARVYDRVHRMYLGLPATLLSIGLAWLLSGETQKSLPNTGIAAAILALQVPVILSLVVSLLSGLNAFLNLSDLSTRHRGAAENLHGLWRDCKNWSTDFPDASDCERAAKAVQAYRHRLNEINRDAPQIPKWAWKSVNKQRAEGSVSYKIEYKIERPTHSGTSLPASSPEPPA
jgi:hypothetical protein